MLGALRTDSVGRTGRSGSAPAPRQPCKASAAGPAACPDPQREGRLLQNYPINPEMGLKNKETQSKSR